MTKETIAVLGGTGNEGPGLAMRWANAGYKVIIGSRKGEKAGFAFAIKSISISSSTIWRWGTARPSSPKSPPVSPSR